MGSPEDILVTLCIYITFLLASNNNNINHSHTLHIGWKLSKFPADVIWCLQLNHFTSHLTAGRFIWRA